MSNLGRIETVRVRDVWQHEALEFTPWLAKPENLKLLASALRLDEIELEATEKDVGRFSADIVARDEAGTTILIENQLEQTDHKHLGQVLTYLAGLDGNAIVVWISINFLEEHRAAIDWLNSNTNDRFDFFGIEIEVLKIGDSAPAPRFSVIAKPNGWTRSVGFVSKQASNGELAERHKIRLAYWASFAEYLKSNDAPFVIRRPIFDHWCTFPIGRAGFNLSCTINTNVDRIGVELYVARDDEKYAIRQLESERFEIESEFDEQLLWQELPGRRASRVAVYKAGIDPADPRNYVDMHHWMLSRLFKFEKAFRSRVKALELNADYPTGQTASQQEPNIQDADTINRDE